MATNTLSKIDRFYAHICTVSVSCHQGASVLKRVVCVRLPYAVKPRDKPPPRDNYTERFYRVMNRDSCSFTSLSTDLKRTGLGNNLNRFTTGE